MTTTNPADASQAAPGPAPIPEAKPPQQAPPQRALATTNDDPSRALQPFASADNMVAAKKMAIDLAASTIIPEAYRGNVSNVLIALELANRIGASPIMVMQSLDIIYGRPSWRSTFLIATINACGKFTSLRYRFQGKEGTDTWGVRAYAKDRETGEELQGPLITIQIAKDEGWYDRKGTKWRTMPELMLTYRAAAFWSRVYAPELSLGIQTAEETIDVHGEVTGEVVRPYQNGAPTTPSATVGPPIPQTTADLEAALRAQSKPLPEKTATATQALGLDKPEPEKVPVSATTAKAEAAPEPQADKPPPAPPAGWPACATCGKPITGEDEPVKTSLGEGKGVGWRHGRCFAPGMIPTENREPGVD